MKGHFLDLAKGFFLFFIFCISEVHGDHFVRRPSVRLSVCRHHMYAFRGILVSYLCPIMKQISEVSGVPFVGATQTVPQYSYNVYVVMYHTVCVPSLSSYPKSHRSLCRRHTNSAPVFIYVVLYHTVCVPSLSSYPKSHRSLCRRHTNSAPVFIYVVLYRTVCVPSLSRNPKSQGSLCRHHTQYKPSL